MPGLVWTALPQKRLCHTLRGQAGRSCCCGPVRGRRSPTLIRAQQETATEQKARPARPARPQNGPARTSARPSQGPQGSKPGGVVRNGAPQQQEQQPGQNGSGAQRPSRPQQQRPPRQFQAQDQQQAAPRQQQFQRPPQQQHAGPGQPQQQQPRQQQQQQQQQPQHQHPGGPTRPPQQQGSRQSSQAFRPPQGQQLPSAQNGQPQQRPPSRAPQQPGGPSRPPQQQYRVPARRPEFQMLQGSGTLPTRGPPRGGQRPPPRGSGFGQWQQQGDSDQLDDDEDDFAPQPLPPPKLEPAHGMKPNVKGIIANQEIEASDVRLLNGDKSMIGIVPLKEALKMAAEEEADVIMISGDAAPPVCRLISIDKYKYEAAKGEREQKRKQREARQDLKELKMRPATESHDYQVRLRSAQKFLTKGDKVKVSVQFKGREMSMQASANEMLQRFIEDVGDAAIIAQPPVMQGRALAMVLAPNRA